MIEYQIISLGELINSDGISVDKLIDSFKRFSCSREKDLETFLVHKAIEYENIEYGKTYLVIDTNKLDTYTFEIIAFFTVGLTSVDISKMSQKKKKKVLGTLPGRDSKDSVPAFLIGQFGRNENYTKDDITGEVLLAECFEQLKRVQGIVGGKMIVVECRESLLKFYKKHAFKQIEENASKEGLFSLYRRLN